MTVLSSGERSVLRRSNQSSIRGST